MDRPNKRSRFASEASDSLKGFCRLGKITNDGLQELLSRLRRNPELLDATRRDLVDEFHSRFDAISTTIDVDLTDGAVWHWPVVEPGLLLQKLLSECPNLFAVFAQALVRTPCTKDRPWSALIGFDEFTPGNKLNIDNRRKTMVLSFTFEELGKENLWRDVVWATPVVVRHAMVAKVVGGWSRMLRDFLRLLFLGPHGLETVGVPVTIGNHTVVIWARMGHLFSDGDGLRLALDWKGAAGLKPCFLHWNVVSKFSEIGGSDYVDVTCSDFRRFRKWNADELEATIDMLTEAKRRVSTGLMANARLEALEKACGFAANPHGLMADVSLRSHFHPSEVSVFDWMHSALQNGTVTEETHLFLKACKSIGFRTNDFETYLQQDWVFPMHTRSKGKGLHLVFNQFRATSSDRADRLKASASELLGLYGLLRHWADSTVGDNPNLVAEKASFDACCEVVDIILRAKHGRVELPTASGLLKRAIVHHMELHRAAYGEEHFKPKHHWMHDVAMQIEFLPQVIDAFIIERLHLRVKRQAEPIKELNVLERSTLAGVVNAMFQEAQSEFGDGLRGTVAPHSGCCVADHAALGPLRFSIGDVVFWERRVGAIKLLAEEDGALYAVVQGYAFKRQVTFPPPALIIETWALVGTSFRQRPFFNNRRWLNKRLGLQVWRHVGSARRARGLAVVAAADGRRGNTIHQRTRAQRLDNPTASGPRPYVPPPRPLHGRRLERICWSSGSDSAEWH